MFRFLKRVSTFVSSGTFVSSFSEEIKLSSFMGSGSARKNKVPRAQITVSNLKKKVWGRVPMT